MANIAPVACTKCDTNPPNPGRRWCEGCYLRYVANLPVCATCRNRQAINNGLCGGCHKLLPSPHSPTTDPQPCLKCRGVPQQQGLAGKQGTFLCKPCQDGIPDGDVYFGEISSTDPRWRNVETQFLSNPPSATARMVRLFAVFNPAFFKCYLAYQQQVAATNGGSVNERRLFHGTTLLCRLHTTGAYCGSPWCATCNITRMGFDPARQSMGLFGRGFYFAYASEKSHQYNVGSESESGVRAMLLCKVTVGKVNRVTNHDRDLIAPADGCHSILGEVPHLPAELIVHNPDAALPSYIILYTY